MSSPLSSLWCVSEFQKIDIDIERKIKSPKLSRSQSNESTNENTIASSSPFLLSSQEEQVDGCLYSS
eukprot:Awhi_evm1s2270